MDTLIEFSGLTAVIIVLFVIGGILVAARVGQRAESEVIYERETGENSGIH